MELRKWSTVYLELYEYVSCRVLHVPGKPLISSGRVFKRLAVQNGEESRSCEALGYGEITI